jgi:FMN phosphatase YigB (HAD superfamily)
MKYIALDIGNVLCNVNFDLFNKKLSKILNISLDDAIYFLNRTQSLHDLGITHMSDELRDHFNIKSSEIIDSLVAEWNDTVSGDIETIDKLHNLIKANDIKIALLSNIGLEHSAIIKNILGETIYNNSIRFFSCDVGARKPSCLYYKTFLDMYPEFGGCLYVDDKIENLDAATKFGFNTRHFALDAPEGISLLEIIERFEKTKVVDI